MTYASIRGRKQRWIRYKELRFMPKRARDHERRAYVTSEDGARPCASPRPECKRIFLPMMARTRLHRAGTARRLGVRQSAQRQAAERNCAEGVATRRKN